MRWPRLVSCRAKRSSNASGRRPCSPPGTPSGSTRSRRSPATTPSPSSPSSKSPADPRLGPRPSGGRIGPAARHLHCGMTSSDVLDTSLAMLLRDAADLLLAGIDEAREAVVKRALEHQRTPCIGRSHGIHAEPTTFGWKLLVWADEL